MLPRTHAPGDLVKRANDGSVPSARNALGTGARLVGGGSWSADAIVPYNLRASGRRTKRGRRFDRQ
jgi:hypothetical protein